MSKEASKLRERWKREGIWDRYFTDGAKILDVGCGNDLIHPTARGYDQADGDGVTLTGVDSASMDLVVSSHFLEHAYDPGLALRNQWRVLKPGGFMITVVPEEDLYEQGIWPSVFNTDHKFTYTAHKSESWSPVSRNLVDLLRELPNHKLISLRTIDTGYDYTLPMTVDQTDTSPAEAAVESIMQKDPPIIPFISRELLEAFLCPKCRRMALNVTGIMKNKHFHAWCRDCGTMVEITSNVVA